MYVTSLQNCQKTNETITFSNNHFCKSCTWHTLNHSKDHKNASSQKQDILTRIECGSARKTMALLGGVGGGGWWNPRDSAGRRRRGRPGVLSLSSSSSRWRRIKSELKKDKIFEYLEEYPKNIQYPENIQYPQDIGYS